MSEEKKIIITVTDNQINIDTTMQSYEVVGLLTGVLQHYQAENLMPTITKMVDNYLMEHDDDFPNPQDLTSICLRCRIDLSKCTCNKEELSL